MIRYLLVSFPGFHTNLNLLAGLLNEGVPNVVPVTSLFYHKMTLVSEIQQTF